MTSPLAREERRELAVVLIVLVVVNILSAMLQKPLSFEGGKGWDGATYYGMADQLAHYQLPRGVAPFVYRAGAPFLASIVVKITDNLLLSFRIVNVAGAAVATLLLLFWLRLHLTAWWVRATLVVLFITQWHAPVRFSHWYPTYVDPWAHVALLAGLIGIDVLLRRPTWRAALAVSLTSFIGVIFREVVIVIPAALLASINPFLLLFRERIRLPAPADLDSPPPLEVPRAAFVAVVASGVLGLALVRRGLVPTNNASALQTAIGWAYRRSLPEYVRAWFIAFGPILVLALYDWSAGLVFLVRHRYVLAYLAGIAALSWVGGTDTERFVYWSLPATYVLIGRAIEQHETLLWSWPLLAVLGATQGISQRLFWTTPDYPNDFPHRTPLLTGIGTDLPVLDLFSFHADPVVARASLQQYLALAAVLLVWLNLRAAWLACKADRTA